MSTYVIGDVHGCYDSFIDMLHLIRFSNKDRLIMLGDYIDRGNQNNEMLDYISTDHSNVVFLKGNHETEFVVNINLMVDINKKLDLCSDYNSLDDTKSLYETCIYYIKKENPSLLSYFDMYGTIKKLIYESNVLFSKLIQYRNRLDAFPYVYKTENIIMVHAGYVDDYNKIKDYYSSIEDFYIYARDDGYTIGGVENGIVISGHTPTIEEDSFCYNDGDIFHYYNKINNCHYYNLDGGFVFRDEVPSAQLCCLRLDDMEEFYI